MTFCQNPALNKKAKNIISKACEFLLEEIGEKPISIILTGSFSRGEGSIYQSADSLIILGDIEFLIYCHKKDQHLGPIISELGKKYSRRLKKQKIDVEIEFSLCTDAFFSGLEPTIFNIELFVAGKVLWGDENALSKLKSLDKVEVNRNEGFCLLCNRIIEQLKNLDSTQQDNNDLLLITAYSNIKLFLDIPTAILATLGKFTTGYRNRLDILMNECDDIGLQIFGDLSAWQNLLKDIEFWTNYKIHPKNIQQAYDEKFTNFPQRTFRDQVHQLWLDLVPITKHIWEWHLHSINNKTSESSPKTSEVNALMLKSPLKTIIKQWVKIIYRTMKVNQKIKLNYGVFCKASPRHLIYQSASLLFFYYPSLTQNSLVTSPNDSLQKIERDRILHKLSPITKLLPLYFNDSSFPKTATIETTRSNIYENWIFIVRNN